MRKLTVVCTLMLGAIASAGYAQPSDVGRLDLYAGAGLDSDPFTFAPDRDNAAMLVAGIGTELPHHWLVRYEFALPAWHELSDINQCRCGTRGEPVNVASDERHRMATHMGVVGYDFAISDRVHVAPLAGLGVVVHADRERASITSLTGAPVSTYDNDESRFHGAFVFGTDVAVKLTERIALIPQIRLHGLPEAESTQMIVRPAVLARISF